MTAYCEKLTTHLIKIHIHGLYIPVRNKRFPTDIVITHTLLQGHQIH